METFYGILTVCFYLTQTCYSVISLSINKCLLLLECIFTFFIVKEERARNVQWAFVDGDDAIDCLKGLDPSHTDWHAKVTFYEVSW